MLQQHFVRFYSPGTFLAEITEKPIDDWNVETAQKISAGITQRYNAVPYGFMFLTRGREDDELDSSILKESKMYYLPHCELVPVEETSGTLRDKLKQYDCTHAVKTTKGWKWYQPFRDGDVLLESSDK